MIEGYDIIEWPDCQMYMEVDGWEENSALIEENEDIGIGSSTFLVDSDWLIEADNFLKENGQ
ncbi:MAG: hypothetical protein Q4C49_00725 [Bacillota bacterium]|nr:hypothetical protein [Bacillota bacterium]